MLEEGIFDIHCHIVPGVDDGAADIEETRKLLEMEYKQGVRNIILTPHFRFQMFETPLDFPKAKKWFNIKKTAVCSDYIIWVCWSMSLTAENIFTGCIL